MAVSTHFKDADLRAATAHLRASKKPLMSAVFKYIHDNHVELAQCDPVEKLPRYQFNFKDGRSQVNVSMDKDTPYSEVAGAIAKGVKYIAQRRMNPGLYAWERLEKDAIHSSRTPEENYMDPAYELLSIADAVLLRLINRMDAQVFSEMIEMEASHLPIRQNEVEYRHIVLRDSPNRLKSMADEEFSRLLRILEIVENENRIQGRKTVAHITGVSCDDLASSAKALWPSIPFMTSPLVEWVGSKSKMKNIIEAVTTNDYLPMVITEANKQFHFPNFLQNAARWIVAKPTHPHAF
jgi:hypothetical protein